MKTVSINVMNLCVPCENRCRYCLLSYDGKVRGVEELAERYGDPDGDRFYSARDLYMHYQRQYLAENRLEIYDIHDERQCFSRRF